MAIQTLRGKLAEFYKSSPMRFGISAWYPLEAELIVIDPPTLDAETFARYRAQLSPQGRALIAWHSDEATDVLRMRLTQDAVAAGFAPEALAWYYPRPDHWFTGEVFSDAYPPPSSGNASTRFPALVLPGSSYLLELRSDAQAAACDVEYAAVSAYRAADRRFATTLCTDGLVRKRALGAEALKGLQRLARNHEELAALGLSVLPLCIEGDEALMPRCALPTLMEHLVSLLSDSSDEGEVNATARVEARIEAEAEVVRLFDRLCADIQRAAIHGSCYWELVPANCFYDAEKDEFTYFDQEFSTEGIPADIAVARSVLALRHTPTLEGNEWSLALSEQLIERYGLRKNDDMIKAYYTLDTTRQVQGDEFMHYLQLVREVQSAAQKEALNVCP